MQDTLSAAEVRFEGFGAGHEITGGTMANYSIYRPGAHAKEAAVLLNDPSAAYLAEVLNEPNTPEFRLAVAQAAGQLWLEHLVAQRRHVGSVHMLSRATFEADPALLESLKALELWPLPPVVVDEDVAEDVTGAEVA